MQHATVEPGVLRSENSFQTRQETRSSLQYRIEECDTQSWTVRVAVECPWRRFLYATFKTKSRDVSNRRGLEVALVSESRRRSGTISAMSQFQTIQNNLAYF